MASKVIPTVAVDFIELGTNMNDGLNKLGLEIGITLVDPTDFRSALDGFILANNKYNAGRSVKLAKSDLVQVAMTALYTWLKAARNVLVPKLGRDWSAAWAQAGFINNSTAVPRTVDGRLGLALALNSFFTANPTYQAVNQNVTAAMATTVRNNALTAQSDLTAAQVALDQLSSAWTVAYDLLATAMRALIKNLEVKLSDSDPRWLSFGLPIPDSNTTPGKPLNLTAMAD